MLPFHAISRIALSTRIVDAMLAKKKKDDVPLHRICDYNKVSVANGVRTAKQ